MTERELVFDRGTLLFRGPWPAELATMPLVLFDARVESPTFESLNVLHFGEANRGLLRIPRGVFHAVQNVGETDAMFVNMPTTAYSHEEPDKYRLPLDTDRIPYSF